MSPVASTEIASAISGRSSRNVYSARWLLSNAVAMVSISASCTGIAVSVPS
ncbi:Uncharacterised protein [Mycobacterium tuberculosis]|uniref:Uncharacterized protein n=1 Tax=Mycobacterium tuberculosis TaxID=1773 RepID=A0A655JT00_MYCTX|nr:Uncharacterised protein [Mycobacterium tuberculosis]COX67647.1 Uncharacterised protein [Mycobacterium tuberculosis]COY86797.1 Uncharacterised protein [Mycobacterium tuberculosis]COZ41738.1 Uncharacterised protein [Mycobacterium tuberculosis]COZ86353.1 Uncharacterised protein [Mycobacterium tuberculosis]